MEIIIRAARPADVPLMRGLLVETWHDTYDGIIGAERVSEITDNWHSLARLEAQVLSDETLLVAEQDKELLGTSYASRGEDGTVWLRRLYIKPNVQGRGIGQRLLAETERLLQPKRIRLEVEPSNSDAISFYERAGFITIKGQQHCGGDRTLFSLLMEKAWP
jgi:ribosomal protein S18 acetylase RimI-like enzyme